MKREYSINLKLEKVEECQNPNNPTSINAHFKAAVP